MSRYLVENARLEHQEQREKLLLDVMRDWPWPWPHSHVLSPYVTEFSPVRQWNVFKDAKLVGFTSCSRAQDGEDGLATTSIPYPITAAEHPEAAQALLEHIIRWAKDEGIVKAEIVAEMMSLEEQKLVESLDFVRSSSFPPGSKMYFVYDLSNGPLQVVSTGVEEVVISRDLDQLAPIANKWFIHLDEVRCRAYLKEDPERFDVIAHLVVRDGQEIAAACYVKPNFLNPSTLAAAYYIYARSAMHLRSLIARAIDACIERGLETFLVDLVNEHRQFEHDYEALGFRKAADYLVYEKVL